jgi:glutamine amidotransferase
VIALIDYGAGNLTSVRKALTALGAPFVVPGDPSQCAGASGLIVPGVGHFAATAALEGPWREAIAAAVNGGTPLLGICLGMQWLFEGSDEAPGNPGLGLLAGRSIRIGRGVKVPHVGWNRLHQRGRCSRLLDGVSPGATMYFSHSYAVPPPADTVATTTHGQAFASVVERGAIFGVQGHPEKSGRVGLRLLGNFVGIAQAGGRC